MKYKPLDKVRINSLDWYNENKGNADKTNSVWCKDGGGWFFYHMSQYCGKIMTIENVWANSYKLEGSDSRWTDEMIEGLVEDEALKQYEVPTGSIKIWDLPNDYQFKDENNNVINAMKIVLEKKKKEYPKTYEECCEVLKIGIHGHNALGYKSNTLSTFQNLIICRDAYWKIAGEEMGFDKPWEPDWEDENQEKYIIGSWLGTIQCLEENFVSHPLAFPTEEMRDAFYENFKELIEQCKELL